MELDSLKFVVDTSDLVDAVTKVQNLQNAVSKLNKPLADTARISAKAAKEAAAVAQAEAKTAIAVSKVEEAQNKANAAKARAQKATEALVKETKEQNSVLERQQAIYEFMTQGYSKGQASVLASAKAQGALADELSRVGNVLKDQRKLVGGDPFDKSTSGLISLKNAMVELRDEARTSAAGIQMSSKQYKEFARDKLRLIEISKAEGASFSELKQRLRDHGAEFVKVTQQVNALTLAEKERERGQRLQANAIRSLAAEDEKMESILRSINAAQAEHISVSDKAARSIANYERNLRLAGISGEQAAVKLEKYRKAAMMAAQAEDKRKVDFLSRALAPQISDVVVSLAGGMNPMTVLLQQGLQVRDLIGLSGVAVNDLQKAFRSAASDMVSSIKGTASALGSLLLGSIIDSGKAIMNFGVQVTGTDVILGKFREKLVATRSETSLFVKVFDLIGKGASAAAGAGIVTLIASLGFFAKGLYDVIKQENELARVLVLNNANLNLSQTETIAYAQSFSAVETSTSKVINVLKTMAATGKFLSSELDLVVKSALDLDKYGGVAIEDTVKAFAKLKEKPVEALLELAKTTGMIAPAVVLAVSELERQGRTAEATALAVKTLADVNSEQVRRMKDDYNGFSLFMIELGSNISNFFSNTFKDLFYKADPKTQIEKQLKAVDEILNNQAGALGIAVGGLGIGEGYYKELRASLSQQLIMLDKVRQSEKDRVNTNVEGAALVGRANSAYLTSLNEEEKYKVKIRDLDKDIAKARLIGDTKSLESLEKAKKFETEAYLKKTKAKKTPRTEAEKIEDRYLRDVERVNDLLEKSKQKTENLTEAERVLMDIRSGKNWNEYNDQQKKNIENLLQTAKVKELDQIATENQRQADEKSLQFLIDTIEEREKLTKDIKDESKELTESISEQTSELSLQLGMLGLISEEQNKKLQLKKLEVKYEKELRRIQEIYSGSERATEEEAALARYKQARTNIETSLAIDTKNKLYESVTDAVVSGLFDGGKSGSQKLRDIIEDELRKPITIFIRAVVSDIFGAGSGTNGQNALTNIISKGSSIIDSMMNFGSNLSGNLSTSILRLGDWMSTSSNSSVAGVGNFLSGNYGTIGKIGGMAGNALAGVGINKAISNGYSISKGADLIGQIASAYFGPIGGAIAGGINRVFGRKLKDTGIQGTFSGDDQFSGNSYQFYKGGFLRSDKTKTGALDGGLSSLFGSAYKSLTSSNKGMAELLGIDASSALSGFSSNIKFSTNGLNDSQIQEKIQEVLGQVAEEQAQRLLGTFETTTRQVQSGIMGRTTRTETSTSWVPSEFVKANETALDALTRLSSSLKSVNSFLENVNMEMLGFSLAGANVASSLVELFGSLDAFNNVTADYYQKFFSEEEKLTKGNELLTKSFQDLGIALPTTISDFRKLIESQDLNTEAGRQTFASLMNLSSAFYEINTASQEAATSMRESFNSIIEEVKRLRGLTTTDINLDRNSFLNTISKAQAGDASAIASLPDMSKALESDFIETANSSIEIARFRAWLANSLTSVVPAFASGGMHSGGVRLVGENGPELEVTGPSRIFSSGDSMGMLSSGNVVEAVNALNENISMLRAEVRADVQHNAKTAKLLDRVIPDGTAISISGSIDGGLV